MNSSSLSQIKPVSYAISPSGEAQVGGCLLSDLAKTHGTPLYVLDDDTFQSNAKAYTTPLATHYPNSLVIYACKAGLTIPIARRIHELGLGADVVSGGELYTVQKAGLPMNKVYFHGNNKAYDELEMAIKAGVRIIVDNETELARITQIAQTHGQKALVLIRLKPEIDAHTHDYIRTGQLDSKFGVSKDSLIGMINGIDSQHVDFLGIHAHIGSQIFDTKPFEELADLMVAHCRDIEAHCEIRVRELNVGGGLGIRYVEDDQAPNISDTVSILAKRIRSKFEGLGMELPLLIMEPGRSIIATAGITLYRIGTLKEIPGIRNYIFIDGGMADNPRPIMYQAKYTYEIANKASQAATHLYSIAGRYCESGDILAKDVQLAKAELGDIVVVYGTGAYNYAMSSNYNRFGRPAFVSLRNGQSTVMVKAETYDDLIRNDC